MLERLTNKRWFQHVDIRMEKRIESMLTFLSRHRGKKLLVDAIKFDDKLTNQLNANYSTVIMHSLKIPNVLICMLVAPYS